MQVGMQGIFKKIKNMKCVVVKISFVYWFICTQSVYQVWSLCIRLSCGWGMHFRSCFCWNAAQNCYQLNDTTLFVWAIVSINYRKTFFFKKNFCWTHVHLWGHWYPCFGLLVTSPLGFKARVGSALGVRNMHSLRFTSGGTPFAGVYCQHSSQSPSPHACFSRGGMPGFEPPTSCSAVWRATHSATATGLLQNDFIWHWCSAILLTGTHFGAQEKDSNYKKKRENNFLKM